MFSAYTSGSKISPDSLFYNQSYYLKTKGISLKMRWRCRNYPWVIDDQ